LKFVDSFARSTIYKELALLYHYPEKSLLTAWQEKNELVDCSVILEEQADIALENIIYGIMDSLRDMHISDMQAEYVRLFDYRPSCPLLESAFSEELQSTPGVLKLSIEEDYSEFGLDRSSHSVEPLDHIMLELEFMHFLSFKEGEALGKQNNEAGKYLMGQGRFCKNHLLKWVPALCECLRENARLPFFQLSANLTRDFILQDSAYIEGLCTEVI